MKTFMNGVSKKSEIIRIVVLVLVSLVPLYLIFRGIVRLANGWVLTTSLAIVCFVLPLLCLLSIFGILRANKFSIPGKVVLCILVYLLFLLVLLPCLFISEFSHLESYSDDEAYSKYIINYYNVKEFPTIAELGDYEKLEYHIYDSSIPLAEPHADLIICKYDNYDYEVEREKALYSYNFQSEPKGAAEPEVSVDGYKFRMLSTEDYFDYFPKDVGFIGVNDKTKEIVYIHYQNVELDYISSTYDFIRNSCGFKYIR